MMAMVTAFGRGSETLRDLWDNISTKTGVDVAIVCAGNLVYCHSKPLIAASPKFKLLLELCPGVLNLGIKPLEALFILKVVYGLTFTFPVELMPSLVSLLNRYEIPHPPLHVSDGPMVSPEIGTNLALSRIAQVINTDQENRRKLEVELRTTLKLQLESLECNKWQSDSKKLKKTVDSGTQTIDSWINVHSTRSVISSISTFGQAEGITKRFSCEVITERNPAWDEDAITTQVPRELLNPTQLLSSKRLSYPDCNKTLVESASDSKRLCIETAFQINVSRKQPVRKDVKLSVTDKLLQGAVPRKVYDPLPKGTLVRREDKVDSQSTKRLRLHPKEICKSNEPLVREGKHELSPIPSKFCSAGCIWCPRGSPVPDDTWKWRAALKADTCYNCISLCKSYSCFFGEQCSTKYSKCNCGTGNRHSRYGDGSLDPDLTRGSALEGDDLWDTDHLGLTTTRLENDLVEPGSLEKVESSETVENVKPSRSLSILKDIKDVESFVVGRNDERNCGNPVSRPFGLTLPASTELVEGIRTIYQPVNRHSRAIKGKVKDPMVFNDVGKFFSRLHHEVPWGGKKKAASKLSRDRPLEDVGHEVELQAASKLSRDKPKEVVGLEAELHAAAELWRDRPILDLNHYAKLQAAFKLWRDRPIEDFGHEGELHPASKLWRYRAMKDLGHEAASKLCTDRPKEDSNHCAKLEGLVSDKSRRNYKKVLESIHEDTYAFESWRKATCLDLETAEEKLSVPGYTDTIHLVDLQTCNEWEVTANSMVKSLIEN